MDATGVHSKAVIAADPGDVYNALTQPNVLQSWWSVWAGCAITSADIDARPGGSYRIESLTKKKVGHYIAGRFSHVSDEVLAFTWETERTTNFVSTVILSLAPADAPGHTLVEIEHRDLFVEDERLRCQKAWRHILAVLARGLRRLPHDQPPPEVRDHLSKRAR